jgi:PilZ domain
MPSGPVKRKPRRRRHHTAWVTLKDGITRVECRVVDVSETGAQIICDRAEALPDRIVIALALTASTKRAYDIVWRRGRTVGIKAAEVMPQA